ncbi:IS982 family transposase [Pedobacter sp.]|uniref:IS982 family transposase n=1 Tax=Pedobacter sp. TaxID=1411316 RepID=UPI003BEF020D
MHCIKSCFDKIMHVLKDILGTDIPVSGNLLRPGPKPKFSDIEVIALSIVAEALSIDSENYLFHKLNTDYKKDFPNILSRRQYNDRRKGLFEVMEKVRQKIADILNEITDVYAIDSMPMEICKLSREKRNKMGKHEEYTKPSKGFCASQNKYFYGYKLHAVCSPVGVIQCLNITNASTHDISYLKEIKDELKNCIVTGDRGYIAAALKKELMEKSNILLEVPSRSNQLTKVKVIKPLRNIRKRIETVFSQLCDQFMIQRNYAKQFLGYKTRILSKVLGMTVLQWINKFIRAKPVGQIKYALS